ncbi:MAG: hypothetical protein H0A76_08595 [Candidatus Thiodubiliella endoseptemdiera]|uniref:Uncharacterized protein n=1 Tax=Candidatus Thiodubiliella endoseptemdiera TaxID=2738886 RepID=A0A853F322_9GAMM|nr:hypothetical protein [Candidatus Thiodubiliella endoseptemdiera]
MKTTEWHCNSCTTGVENNQEVSLVINQKTYTGTVTSNSATITVAATDLQALTHGQTYSP